MDKILYLELQNDSENLALNFYEYGSLPNLNCLINKINVPIKESGITVVCVKLPDSNEDGIISYKQIVSNVDEAKNLMKRIYDIFNFQDLPAPYRNPLVYMNSSGPTDGHLSIQKIGGDDCDMVSIAFDSKGNVVDHKIIYPFSREPMFIYN